MKRQTTEKKMMSYRFLEDVAIADVAFEARGKSLAELFSNAALAVTNTMVQDVGTVEQKVAKNVELEADDLKCSCTISCRNLFYKDAELLLFSGYDIDISQEIGKWRLHANMREKNFRRRSTSWPPTSGRIASQFSSLENNTGMAGTGHPRCLESGECE
jgi:SHS2 domain-containing protein